MAATTITSIQRGIVFLMADWSGGARWAYPRLVAFLKEHGIASEELHVLNVDDHPELYNMPELSGKIHGWGEALVVKAGRIVLFTRLGKDQPLIQEHCDQLLRVYVG
ncbi:MAG TPA: hypothetical protein VLT36_02220 [Candidatus Dormibacteraeota bacterium]|nr:hypothetical protein [Candidatus Dormibacteraeota bacterium]